MIKRDPLVHGEIIRWPIRNEQLTTIKASFCRRTRLKSAEKIPLWPSII